MTDGRQPARLVLVFADESCLGNQRVGRQPGGAGALIECRANGGIERRDWFAASPTTTNNRMALHGAIAVLEHLFKHGGNTVHYHSDSRYLVDGITNWIHDWKSRGWKRKAGPIENLELWQQLDRTVAGQPVRFHWIKGHAGHQKNEYADHLAVRAAETQRSSDGLPPSGLRAWLDTKRGHAVSSDDPDEHFTRFEATHG